MLVAAEHRDCNEITIHIRFTLKTLPSKLSVLWDAGGWDVMCADGLTSVLLNDWGSVCYSTRMDTGGVGVESVQTDDKTLTTTGTHTITIHHNECYATIFVDGHEKVCGVAFLPSVLMKHWRFSALKQSVPAFGSKALDGIDADVHKCIVFAGHVREEDVDTTDAPVILQQQI